MIRNLPFVAMSNLVAQPLVSSFVLAATMIVSAVTAAFLRPGKILCTIILHFAGGMVFAVVAVELWPFVRDLHASIAEATGFVTGIAILLGLRRLTHNAVWKNEKSSSATPLPVNVLVETGENIVIDGLVISIAFAAEPRAGLFLTLALAIEAVSLGIAAAGRSSKSSHAKQIALAFFLGSCYVIATGIGILFLRHLSDNGLGIALSFGSAALLFLATEEVLVEAREIANTPLHATAFFGGFLVLLLIENIAGVF